MSRRKKRAESPELRTARQEVDRWREQRKGTRSRVRQDVWDVAVAAARVEGVWATSQALGLKYDTLKERHDAPVGKLVGISADRGGAAFVEVPAVEVMGRGEGKGDVEVGIELIGRRGDRMRIAMMGARTVDIVELSQTFWRGQS